MIIQKKIVIKGPKVQNVGYRPFLLDVADSELLPNFDAKNKKEIDKDGNEIVEIFVGGPNEQIDNFIEFIKDKNNRPENAEVESIEVVDKDYKRNIRTTESFSRWLSNNQLYKMATIGTVMLGKQDMMLEKLDETKKEIVGEIKDLRWDLKSYLDQRLIHIENDIAHIKAKIKMTN
jgi:acylphosphatase